MHGFTRDFSVGTCFIWFQFIYFRTYFFNADVFYSWEVLHKWEHKRRDIYSLLIVITFVG